MEKIKLLIGFLFIVLLTSGCSNAKELSKDNPGHLTIELNTDKETYHSNEVMNITISIDSLHSIENAKIKIYGINARTYRLNNELEINISKGINVINFEYKTPSCTGCAGISPRLYNVNCELIYNNRIIANIIKEVNIQQ